MTGPSHPSVRERPLSPHLGIYKPQITSILSIMHRASGAWLFIGALVFAWSLVYKIYSPTPAVSCQCIVQLAAMATWSTALFYHLLNGIRHLFWDMGKSLDLCAVTWSGWAVLLGTIALTVLSWSFVIL